MQQRFQKIHKTKNKFEKFIKNKRHIHLITEVIRNFVSPKESPKQQPIFKVGCTIMLVILVWCFPLVWNIKSHIMITNFGVSFQTVVLLKLIRSCTRYWLDCMGEGQTSTLHITNAVINRAFIMNKNGLSFFQLNRNYTIHLTTWLLA